MRSKNEIIYNFRSNAYLQQQRDTVLDILRKSYSFIISGNEAIPLVCQYGIEQPLNASIAFSVQHLKS